MAVGKHRFIVLDALRGVAAFCVLFRHFSMTPERHSLPLSYLAVDFFFVLSGFVLEPTFKSGSRFPDVLRYMAKRAIRLWPAYLLGLSFSLPGHWLVVLCIVLVGVMAIPLPFHLPGRWLHLVPAAIQLVIVFFAFPLIVMVGSCVVVEGKLESMAMLLGEISYLLYGLHVGLGYLANCLWQPPADIAPYATIIVAFLIATIAWAAGYFYEDPVRKVLGYNLERLWPVRNVGRRDLNG